MTTCLRTCGLVAVIALGLQTLGCNSSSSSSSSGGTSMDSVAAQLKADQEARQKKEASAKAEADRQAAAAAAQPAPEPEKKAVGSRPPMEGGGYFRAIGSARRHVYNTVEQLAWIQGVRSFKAEEGRKPKNHEEFLKVVQRYELQLPRLEEGQEYLYDPNGETDGDFGQLYIVEKSATPAATQPPAQSSSQPAPN
jgi:hypothetical protein